MNHATGLDYPYPEPPALGGSRELVPGIHWLRLPLPFGIDHINVWLLEDGDGWLLVDTGIAADVTRAAWTDLERDLLRDRPIQRIIVTHHHPDHFGLAHWHSERHACPVFISTAAMERVRYLLQEDISGIADQVAEFYRRQGIAEPGMFVQFDTGRRYGRVVSGIPGSIHTLDAGTELEVGGRRWRVQLSNGHAEGHASLYCAQQELLISGDQILPTISSNISLYAHGRPDPLRDYLDSLQHFSRLPASTLVLPSHGRVFRGLHRRIGELQADHGERLRRVQSYCAEPGTALDILHQLFPRRLDDLNLLLACGETLAHLRHLERSGKLVVSDRGGVCYYQAQPGESG